MSDDVAPVMWQLYWATYSQHAEPPRRGRMTLAFHQHKESFRTQEGARLRQAELRAAQPAAVEFVSCISAWAPKQNRRRK
jgi:hypothetical protein